MEYEIIEESPVVVSYTEMNTSQLSKQMAEMQRTINQLTEKVQSHQDELYLLYSELLSDLVILTWRTLENDYSPKRGEGWAAYLQRLMNDTNALRIRDLRPHDIEFLATREKEIWHRDKHEFVVSKRRSLALIKSDCVQRDRGHYMRFFRYIVDHNANFVAPLPTHFFKVQ
ncbi:hypothetical protein AYI68_g5199 [Smittium mucronatum]|uniref:Uncharacterized protein n=1 Tax=Smittium mucronatum TaxID=133383 RepID=A0A1R0GUX9_9FUNG|nr:hypothetical protein AYI68_g5199 [Smittium mucronatum]